MMTTEEIISSLEDQAQDKDRLAGGDPDSVFTADAIVLIEAAKLLRAQQAPAKLDRSRWEECEWCKQRYCDNCFWQIKMKDSSRCKRCIDKSQWSPLVSYCSNCGRPLTDEAWAELERRIGGKDGT